MRQVIINILKFNELTSGARENAFKQWIENHNPLYYGYPNYWDFQKVIDTIEKSGLVLNHYHFNDNKKEFDFTLNLKLNSLNVDDLKNIIGKKAIKIAIKLFDDLTLSNSIYVKYSHDDAKFVQIYSNYLNWRDWAEYKLLNNYDKMQIRSICFTGLRFSSIFANALINEIYSYKNNVNSANLHTILHNSFYALFKAKADDCNYLKSFENFAKNEAEKFEFLEDGTIYQS